MKAIILVAADVQDQEFFYPFYRLQEFGFEVDVAAPTGTETIHGKYGIPINPNLGLQWLNVEDYDLVVVPGGYGCPEKLRMNSYALKFIKDMDIAGKIVSAICHGPWALISAGIMRGRKATCYAGMKDDLVNSGATYIESDVVVDGNLVTSPHYRNNPQFMKALLDLWTTMKQS